MLLSTFGGRGDVEPLVGLAAELRALGAEVRVGAPADDVFVHRLGEVGVELLPVGPSARELMRAADGPPSIPTTARVIIANQFETLGPEIERCDAVVATGALPAAAGALSVEERAGIPAYRSCCGSSSATAARCEPGRRSTRPSSATAAFVVSFSRTARPPRARRRRPGRPGASRRIGQA